MSSYIKFYNIDSHTDPTEDPKREDWIDPKSGGKKIDEKVGRDGAFIMLVGNHGLRTQIPEFALVAPYIHFPGVAGCSNGPHSQSKSDLPHPCVCASIKTSFKNIKKYVEYKIRFGFAQRARQTKNDI